MTSVARIDIRGEARVGVEINEGPDGGLGDRMCLDGDHSRFLAKLERDRGEETSIAVGRKSGDRALAAGDALDPHGWSSTSGSS